MHFTPDHTWNAFRRGNREAFEQIYRENVRGLINYGYKVTSDRRLIEDSVQDLFVELWNSRTRLSETTSVRFYLFKALRHKIVRNSRQYTGRVLEEFTLDQDQMIEVSHESYLIGLEVQSLQMANLRELIAALPARQREAINLRYFQNFSNDEVARIMGVNYQSACKFIYAALKNLKHNLQISVTSWLPAIFFSFLMG
jgi:RNA polymerase sigma factor (sigma-70 family)